MSSMIGSNLVFAELSEQESQYETPELPKWIFDDEGEDESEEKEGEKKITKPKRKRVSKKDVKGKEKIIEFSDEEEAEEDEETLRKVRKIDEEEDEEEIESDEEEEEQDDKKQKSPKPTQKEPTPEKQDQPTKKEPEAEKQHDIPPIQQPETVNQPQIPPQQTQTGPILTPTNFMLETETILQVIHELSGEGEEENAGNPEQLGTDAHALVVGASHLDPTVSVNQQDPKETLDVMMQQLAEKKKEELGSTKKDAGVSEVVKESTKEGESEVIGEEIGGEKFPEENLKEAEAEATEEPKGIEEGTNEEATKEGEPTVTNEHEQPATAPVSP